MVDPALQYIRSALHEQIIERCRDQEKRVRLGCDVGSEEVHGLKCSVLSFKSDQVSCGLQPQEQRQSSERYETYETHVGFAQGSPDPAAKGGSGQAISSNACIKAT
jgi:hypothetical protein